MKETERKWRRVADGLSQNLESGVFYANFRIPGIRAAPILRSLRTTDLQTAKSSVAKLKADFFKSGNREDRRLGFYVDLYKRSISHLESNGRAFRLRIADGILQSVGDMPIRQIRPSDLEPWFADKKEAYKPATCKVYLQTVTKIFQQAVHDGMLLNSPTARLRGPKIRPSDRPIPTLAEFEAILDYVETYSSNRAGRKSRQLIEFLGAMGIGIAEATSLRWEAVDFENGFVHLTRKKTQQPFSVPLFSRARRLLLEIRSQSGNDASGKVFAVQSVNMSINTACRVLQLRRFTTRSFRRMFICECIRRGVDIKTLSNWQAHNDGGTLILNTYSAEFDKKHIIAMAKKVDF